MDAHSDDVGEDEDVRHGAPSSILIVTGPPPLAGPSVVMNGTKLVGGSLSTNLPHTPFPPVPSAASMKMQNTQKVKV